MFQKTYFFTFPYLFSSKQILNNKKIFTFQLKKIQKNNLKNYVNKQKIYMRERERERERGCVWGWWNWWSMDYDG